MDRQLSGRVINDHGVQVSTGPQVFLHSTDITVYILIFHFIFSIKIRIEAKHCTCHIPFQITRVGEGKYTFGTSKIVRLVRVHGSSIVVRVGGGWEYLYDFLFKADPCRGTCIFFYNIISLFFNISIWKYSLGISREILYSKYFKRSNGKKRGNLCISWEYTSAEGPFINIVGVEPTTFALLARRSNRLS